MWIDVKDELPNKLQKVLFHWIYLGSNKNLSMGYMCDDGWNIYLPYHSFGLRPELMPVTHWMPLPDYPKIEELCEFQGVIINKDGKVDGFIQSQD